MISRKPLAMAVVLVGTLFSSAAFCDVAISIPNTFVTDANNLIITNGNYVNIGWQFSPNANLQVTSLGIYDPNSYTQDMQVGIFDASSHALLVSTTVPANSSASGPFVYESISPYTLTAGTSYIVNAYVGVNYWLYTTNFTVNSALTVAPTGEGWDSCCSPVGFEFPGAPFPLNQTPSYSQLAGQDVGAPQIFLGPNFTFGAGAVPEPSTWAMMILGFAGIGFMAYRRKLKPVLMAA